MGEGGHRAGLQRRRASVARHAAHCSHVGVALSLLPKGVRKCLFATLLGLTRLTSPPRTGNDVVVAEMIARIAPFAALYVFELCPK